MSSKKTSPHPPIVSQKKWLAERKKLLRQEKRVTREYDRVSAARRKLPMVRLDKEYVFETHQGAKSLRDLFEGRRQLIVYHFMFDPKWTKGCPGCTGFVNALGDISMLEERDTTFVLISRAPLDKLRAYQRKMGWQDRTWVSSGWSDFNYDFHVTLDRKVAPPEYNYKKHPSHSGESHGLSVFFRVGKEVFHTYSAYARGVESVADSYTLLDCTPFGRQEDWETSPRGWPQRPTYV
jgi:predicted dithiol-disulfide oxidoreductase (DUF899 family)